MTPIVPYSADMQFHNPVEIVNYPGCRQALVERCDGKNVLVFCSMSALRRYENDEKLCRLLSAASVIIESNFESNPSLADLDAIAAKYKNKYIDVIIGLGGGSSLDAAKVSAVSIPASRRGFSIGNLLDNQPGLVGFDAIETYHMPTTAGTGSEVTPFATIWDYAAEKKLSLFSPKIFPRAAYVDAELLHDIPLDIALSTGLDAVNQSFESIWNKNANPATRAIAIESICLGMAGLLRLNGLGDDIDLAQDLATASVMSGVAISNTRTSVCHSISYPLTLQFGLPHGFACAFTMLAVYEFNKAAIGPELAAISARYNGLEPRRILENIFEKYGYYEIVRQKISNRSAVLALKGAMLMPGRADNNIISVRQADLVGILNQSCDMAGIG